MTIHAPLAKKMARLQNRDDRFLALLGDDGQLDLSVLNIKHGIRDVALRKDDLILVKFNDSLACADLGEEVFGIKHVGRWLSGHLITVWAHRWAAEPTSM